MISDGEGRHRSSRTPSHGEWDHDPEQIMRELVDGELSLLLEPLQAEFLDWMESDDYNLFINTETGERLLSLVCKRGNVVYATRKTILRKEIVAALAEKQFDWAVPHCPNRRMTNILFSTVTFDHVQFTAEEAWAALRSTEIEDCDALTGVLNRFTANLRKIFGPFGKLVVKEAQENFYPAPHMIIILDNPVMVERHVGKKGVVSWRICDPRILRRLGKDPMLRRMAYRDPRKAMKLNPVWKYGFFDIEGVVKDGDFRGRKNVSNYVFKYVTKSLITDTSNVLAEYDSISEIKEHNLRIIMNTHFANKCFRTRDISYGKGFKERLGLLPSPTPEGTSPWKRIRTVLGGIVQLATKVVAPIPGSAPKVVPGQ